MTVFIQQLLRCSLWMAVLALAYAGATYLLPKRYAPRWLYLAGLILAIGFLIPLRPQVVIPVQAPPVAAAVLQTDAPEAAAAQQAATITLGAGAPENPPAPTPPRLTPWELAFCAWALGAAAVLGYHAARHRRFMKTATRWMEPVRDPRVLALFEETKQELGVTGKLALKRCPCVPGPMLVGFFRPAVLLPEELPPDQDLRMILRHELVHYRRRDLWSKAASVLAMAIHWFNPAAYLLARALALHCEISCDEAAMRGLGTDLRQHYAMAILGVARVQTRRLTVLSTSFYGGKDSMKKRIASIVDATPGKAGVLLLALTLVLTLGAGTALAVQPAPAPLTFTEAGSISVSLLPTSLTATPAFTTASRQVHGILQQSNAATSATDADLLTLYAAYGLTYDRGADTLSYQGIVLRSFSATAQRADGTIFTVSHYTPDGEVDMAIPGIVALGEVTFSIAEATTPETTISYSQVTEPAQGIGGGRTARSSGVPEEVQPPTEGIIVSRAHGLDEAGTITIQTNPGGVSVRGSQALEAQLEEGVDGTLTIRHSHTDDGILGATDTKPALPPHAGGIPADDEVSISFSGSVETTVPADMTEEFARYVPFGVTYDARTGAIFYNGTLVRQFEDAQPDGEGGYARFFSCINNEGEVDIRVVYGKDGTMTGVAVY